MRRRFFSGDTIGQAVNQAAQHFQVPAAEIDYKLVEKRHGFLKVRRKVVIEVDENNPVRNPDRAETASAASTESASSDGATDTWSEVVRVPPATESAPADAPGPPRESPVEPEEPAAAEEPKATSWFDHNPIDEPADAEPEPSFEPESAADVMPTDAAPSDETPRPAVDESEDEPAGPPAESEPRGRSRRGRGRRGGRGGRNGARRVELAEAPPAAKARFPEAQGEEAEAAADALERILKLAGLVVESEILQADEHLQIELRGADQDLLLRDRGRLLLAIQHLLPRAIRGLIGRSVVCKVDSDNYHEIREERLRDMAQRAADEVRDRGRPKTLEPMSPDERRIVHLTLADYPGVETESHGSGLFKRVMVRSVGGGRGQGSENYRR